MIKLAIVDDDELDKMDLRSAVSAALRQLRIAFSLNEFNDGERLLNYIRQGHNDFDVILLDIYMKKNGIETAKQLRELSVKSRLVFVTQSPHHALEAFNVFASGYVLKPVEANQLVNIFNNIINELKREHARNSRQLLIKSKGSNFAISYDKILSIESALKKVNVFLEDGMTYECSDVTLTEIFNKLNDNRFLRCHNSFIVNMDKIVKVTNSFFTLLGGKTADITKRHYATMKRKYFGYLSTKPI